MAFLGPTLEPRLTHGNTDVDAIDTELIQDTNGAEPDAVNLVEDVDNSQSSQLIPRNEQDHSTPDPLNERRDSNHSTSSFSSPTSQPFAVLKNVPSSKKRRLETSVHEMVDIKRNYRLRSKYVSQNPFSQVCEHDDCEIFF